MVGFRAARRRCGTGHGKGTFPHCAERGEEKVFTKLTKGASKFDQRPDMLLPESDEQLEDFLSGYESLSSSDEEEDADL